MLLAMRENLPKRARRVSSSFCRGSCGFQTGYNVLAAVTLYNHRFVSARIFETRMTRDSCTRRDSLTDNAAIDDDCNLSSCRRISSNYLLHRQKHNIRRWAKKKATKVAKLVRDARASRPCISPRTGVETKPRHSPNCT